MQLAANLDGLLEPTTSEMDRLLRAPSHRAARGRAESKFG
jgi:hypothetical protein